MPHLCHTPASEFKRNQQFSDTLLDAFVEFSRAAGPAQARKIPRRLMKLLLPLFMKRSDLQQKLELLDSNLREHEQIARSDNTYKKYAEVSAKTLLLFGGKSGLTWVSPAIEKLATVLPSVEKKGFPRLNHFGPDQTGPGEGAQAVKEFFLA